MKSTLSRRLFTVAICCIGAGTRAAYETIREVAAYQTEDTCMAPEVEKIYRLIVSGKLLKEVNKVLPQRLGILAASRRGQ